MEGMGYERIKGMIEGYGWMDGLMDEWMDEWMWRRR